VISLRDIGSDTESTARRNRAWPPLEPAFVQAWLEFAPSGNFPVRKLAGS